MKAEIFDEKAKTTMLTAQGNEITEHFVYRKLSESTKDPHNRDILEHISRDELEHYDFWKQYTGKDVKPDRFKVWMYFLISRVFGLTFAVKLMEKGEEQAQVTYEKISEFVPEAKTVVEDEDVHEKQLLDMIDEERLRYVGSMVLGLNDALVELTGALAGLTLALQDSRLIAMAGSITGVAASLSMAASEYLSTKSEEGTKNPFKASIYTGSAYIVAVLFLILPYLVFTNFYLSLAFTILNALVVMLIFTFYVSVAKDISFRNRFFEMAVISFGVAGLTFGIGFAIRIFLNIEI